MSGPSQAGGPEGHFWNIVSRILWRTITHSSRSCAAMVASAARSDACAARVAEDVQDIEALSVLTQPASRRAKVEEEAWVPTVTRALIVGSLSTHDMVAIHVGA